MSNNSRFFFVLLSVGAAIGLGNIWLFPHLSYKFSGLFFIPYLIALLVLGFPLLLLEFTIGQYFDKDVVDCFASVRKWFSSIGWLMVINAIILMSIYAVIFAWHIIYFFVSFGQQWKNDAFSYFFINVVQASSGFKSFTQFSFPLFLALILAWTIIFLYIRKGYESMKKTFLATFTALLALIFFFLLYTLSLDSALQGVYSFLKPSFKSLMKPSVWFYSFSLAAASLGLSFGIMPAFARKSDKGFNVGNASIVVVFELMLSIILGFIIFSILGFLSMKKGINIQALAFNDPSSEFTVLAQALPLLPHPTIMSMLFFVFTAIFLVLGISSLAYSISHVFIHKFKTKHFSAAVTASGIGFLAGFALILGPGYYVMDIINHFFYYNILIVLFLETAAIGWFFEIQKLADFINQNSALKIGALWAFMIRYITPLLLALLIFIQVRKDIQMSYSNYPWQYLIIFGFGIVVAPIVIAFLMPQKLLDRK